MNYPFMTGNQCMYSNNHSAKKQPSCCCFSSKSHIEAKTAKFLKSCNDIFRKEYWVEPGFTSCLYGNVQNTANMTSLRDRSSIQMHGRKLRTDK